MSNLLLPEAPAHSRLRPEPPVFRPVAGRIAGVILAALGEGELLGLEEDRRHFLYRDQKGEEFFLRLVDGVSLERQLAAGRVADHLAGRGVSCLHPFRDPPLPLSGGRWLLRAPFIPHRFALAGEEDLHGLGRQIALMHRALGESPWEAECRQRTAGRLQMLRHRAVAVLESKAGREGRAGRLQELVVNGQGELWEVLEGGSRQCIHGDLHYTNVLFPLAGGAPLLIDFEDSAISWFDPALDLAQALERFVLTTGLPQRRQRQLAQALLAGYAEGGGRAAFGPGPALTRCLRALSLRALLTLAEAEAAGRPVAESEWEKFFSLHAAAGEAGELIEGPV